MKEFEFTVTFEADNKTIGDLISTMIKTQAIKSKEIEPSLTFNNTWDYVLKIDLNTPLNFEESMRLTDVCIEAANTLNHEIVFKKNSDETKMVVFEPRK